MECKDLWHKAACGHLVQGLVHNMSGPLQILSMQVELLKLSQAKLQKRLPAELQEDFAKYEEKLNQIETQLIRLKKLLEAISETTQDSPGPVDLNALLEKMLIFWEGDLKFKHEVEKEVSLSEEPLQIVAPLGELTQGFCALFWALVPLAVKEKRPFFVKSEKGPVVEIGLKGGEIPADSPLLEAAKEILSPYAEVILAPDRLVLKFKSS